MDICLKASKLSKQFNSLSVIDNWNLEIAKGERLAIIGPSGCGKTTFLRMLAGIEEPTDGLLQMGYHKGSFVFQEPRLIPWKTVRDNLLFICPDGPYKQILERLELSNYENYFSSQLSGGMAQRVNLARALINEPDLLILDEAFFALDLGIKYRIIEYLLSLWKERNFTLVFVTHDIRDAILLSERIIVLSQKPSQIKADFVIQKNLNLSHCDNDLQIIESEITSVLVNL
jgi:NitT/TauT family transport system ATP-binding protein